VSETLKAERGPWTGGYTSAIPAFFAGPDQIVGEPSGSDTASSRDCIIDPFTGGISKRAGCVIVGDTLSNGVEQTGLLNKSWGARARRLFALDSKSMTDGHPVPAILYGEDTNAGFPTADIGFPATIYVRSSNTVLGTEVYKNYSLLEEFSTTSYKSGVNISYTTDDFKLKVVPIWVDSGDGVYNRGALTGTGGADQFMQQFLACGSRNVLQTQRWLYTPNLRCTPWRWNKRLNEQSGTANDHVRIYPTGPLPPLFPPRYSDGADLPTPANGSSWVEGDTFYVSCVFQFEDGSYSAPVIPRPSNTTLTGGLGRVTVGSISATPTNKYPYITYRNVPIGPEGTVARILLRTPKQNRTAATDTITVSPLDLRITGVLRNNTQTTYRDYAGDDDSLLEDDNVVRFDYMMPRRARYIGSGDQRALISYTLPNTAAILLSLVNVNGGGADNYDMNVRDTETVGTNPYGDAEAALVRITSTQLELHYNPAGAPNFAGAGNATAFTFASYPTIGQLVDAINATTTSSNCEQWAAQLAPGVDDTMLSEDLTRTSLAAITDCTTNGTTTLTSATSTAFNSVGVGMKVTGTDISAGTYVLSKASGSSLTLSTAATGSTAGTASITFYQETGDNGIVTGGTVGYIRCFGPNYPILLHMKPSAFPGYDTPDKAGVYFTLSSPGANSSGTSMAPNSWVAGNKRVPVSGSRSVMQRACTGIVDMEGTALVAYSDGIYMLKNVRGANSGEDEDYRLFTINESRGCISYLGLISGNGWAVYPTTEGIFATDKNGREFNISGAVFNPSDGKGDLAYEILTSAASAASDSDDQYLGAAVMGSKLAISFRTQQAASYAVLFYDFSPGIEASGVEELIRPDNKQPYIWSPPALYNYSAALSAPIGAMGSVRNASGRNDYVTFESNAGSTGDGRMDKVNTSDDDNGTDFFSYAVLAPLMATEFMSLSPQRCEVTHLTTTGSPSNLYFANDQVPTFGTGSPLARALPVSASKTRFQKQVVPIDQGQRGKTDMLWFQWRASTTGDVTTRLYRLVVQYAEVDTA
jgi:hypothetical protein